MLTVHSGRMIIDAPPTAPSPTAPRTAAAQSTASLSITERGPTVSSLMVTRNRLALARRAIDCLRAQTHDNVELVIVTDGTPSYGRLLQRYAIERGLVVKLVPVTGPRQSLGALRNLSFAAATGDVVCQWDDDDCSHPTRIARQLDRLRSTDSRACLLTDHLQYLDDNRALVWVDWTLGGRSGRDQLLPGTLMMAADRRFGYPETGPYAQRGEDSALLNSLVDRVPVASLRGEGHLYLYTYHGRNTFDREHHHRMGMFSRSVAELQVHRAVITEAMSHYPVPRPYLVVGRDGPAFWLAA